MKKYFYIVILFLVALNACEKNETSSIYFEDNFDENSNWILEGFNINKGCLEVNCDGGSSANAIASLEKENNRIISEIKIQLKGLKSSGGGSGNYSIRFLINNVEIKIYGGHLQEEDVLIEYFGNTETLTINDELVKSVNLDTEVSTGSFDNNFINFSAYTFDPYDIIIMSLDHLKVEVKYFDQ